MKMLEQKHVKSDFEAMRIAYEYYLQNGADEMYNSLLFGNPIRYIKISKFSPETEFSKLIISQELYKHLVKRKRLKRKQLEQPFLKRWAAICFECNDDLFEQLNRRKRRKKAGKVRRLTRKGKEHKRQRVKGFSRAARIEEEFKREAEEQEQKIYNMQWQMKGEDDSSVVSLDWNSSNGSYLLDQRDKKGGREDSYVDDIKLLKIDGRKDSGDYEDYVDEIEELNGQLPLKFYKNGYTEEEKDDDIMEEDDEESESSKMQEGVNEKANDDQTSWSGSELDWVSDTSSLVNALEELLEQQRIERELQAQIEEREKQMKERKEALKQKENKEKKEKEKKKIVIRRIKKVDGEKKEQNELDDKANLYIPNLNKIPMDIMKAISAHDFSQSLGANSRNSREKFVHKMLRMYMDASGIMNYMSYKNMLRESGVIPCNEIQDFQVDLVYSQFTLKKGSAMEIHFNEARLGDMLTEIAVLKFPDLGRVDAFVKLLRMYLWPYLLLRRKEIQEEYPGEYEYLKFLLDRANLQEQLQKEEFSRIEQMRKKEEEQGKSKGKYASQPGGLQEEEMMEEVEEEVSQFSLSDSEHESEVEIDNKVDQAEIEETRRKLIRIGKSRQEQEELIKQKQLEQQEQREREQRQRENERQNRAIRKQEKQQERARKMEEREKREMELELKRKQREEQAESMKKQKEESKRQSGPGQINQSPSPQKFNSDQAQKKSSENLNELIKFELKNKAPQNRNLISQEGQTRNLFVQSKLLETALQIDSENSPYLPKKKKLFIQPLPVNPLENYRIEDVQDQNAIVNLNVENQKQYLNLNAVEREAVLEYYDSDEESLADERFATMPASCCNFAMRCLQRALQGIMIFPKVFCYIESPQKNEWLRKQMQSIQTLHLPKNSNKVFRHAQSPDWKTISKLIVSHIPMYQQAFIRMGMARA